MKIHKNQLDQILSAHRATFVQAHFATEGGEWQRNLGLERIFSGMVNAPLMWVEGVEYLLHKVRGSEGEKVNYIIELHTNEFGERERVLWRVW